MVYMQSPSPLHCHSSLPVSCSQSTFLLVPYALALDKLHLTLKMPSYALLWTGAPFLPFCPSNVFSCSRLNPRAPFSTKGSLIHLVRIHCISFVSLLCAYISLCLDLHTIAYIFNSTKLHVCISRTGNMSLAHLYLSASIVPSHIAFHTVVDCLMMNSITPFRCIIIL